MNKKTGASRFFFVFSLIKSITNLYLFQIPTYHRKQNIDIIEKSIILLQIHGGGAHQITFSEYFNGVFTWS